MTQQGNPSHQAPQDPQGVQASPQTPPVATSPFPEDGRLCASRSPTCTGLNPCTHCEEAFFVAVVEPAAIAVVKSEAEMVTFVQTYMGTLAGMKGEIAKAAAAAHHPVQAPLPELEKAGQVMGSVVVPQAAPSRPEGAVKPRNGTSVKVTP